MWRFLVASLLIGWTTAAPSSSDSCVLPISGKFGFHAPLFFNDDGTMLSLPRKSPFLEDYTLDAGQTVTLSCYPNFFKERAAMKTSVLRATCSKNNQLVVNGQSVDYYPDMSCDLRPIEEIMMSVNGCPKDDRGVEFGFTNPVNNKSYVVGESCYCTGGGRTIFVHERLRHSGKAITDLALKIGDEHYFKNSHPSNYYRIEFLKSTNIIKLQETYASLGIEDPDLIITKFINSDYLIHRQLNSVSHFTWNSLPLLRTDDSNLAVLQKDILELGVFDLDLYVGTHQTLKLPKKNDDEEVSLFLRGNKFPVPKFVWTVAKTDDKAAVFIYLNNPHVSEKIVDDIGAQFCESKCSKISWITNLLEDDRYKDVKNGYIWCCEYRDVADKIKEIPDLTEVTGFFK